MPLLLTEVISVNKHMIGEKKATFLDESIWNIALAAKSAWAQCQSFFCLRIEGWVHDHCFDLSRLSMRGFSSSGSTDEDPHMIFDLKCFDRRGFVLLLDRFDEGVGDLIHHVIDMGPTLDSCDSIAK